MRDIKFRAWDKNNKNLLKIFDSTTQEYWFIPMWNKNFEIMQYTGLKDRKGKEIYEGDILDFEDTDNKGRDFYNRAELEFNKGRYEFKKFLIEDTYVEEEMHNSSNSDFIDIIKDSDVVGNIYENPELLEGENNVDS